MQLNTLAHLKKLRHCINFRLKQLENNMVFVNAALEIIINNIKIRIHEIYNTENVIHVFFDGITFVRIFDEIKKDKIFSLKTHILFIGSCYQVLSCTLLIGYR